MLEVYDKVGYEEWDRPEFVLPENLRLDKNSKLHEAINVFYLAGGYDFFKVIRPEKYASNWLEFIGNLYREIEDGEYRPDGEYHKNPLTDEQRESLIAQGVPNIFTDDIQMYQKSECELLLEALLPFAEESLKTHGEYYPFGAVILDDGTVEKTAVYDGNEFPESADVINALIKEHKSLAQEGKIKASGIVWNGVSADENGKKTDTVVVSLEHKDSYSVVICEPYKIGFFKKVKFGDLFAIEGKNDIF